MSIATLALAACAAAPLQDAAAAEPGARPAFRLLRQDEDWSDFEGDGHWSDPIKNVRTSRWVDLSVGGSLRARFEAWNGFDFGPPPPADDSDTFLLTNAVVHADLAIGRDERLFVQVRTAQATDRSLAGGRRVIDLDTFDFQQAFYEVRFGEDDAFELRLGRQQFAFGGQRLVSPLPWGNAWRSWDGASLAWSGHGWKVTGLYTQFVQVDKTDLNEADEQNAFFGLYATRAPRAGELGLDVYALGTERDPRTVNGTTGEEQRLTVGLRLFGPLGGGFDLDAEAATQRGEVGAFDLDASMFAAQVGWRAEPGAPRFFAGFDAASGDDAGGGDVGTFDPLFPLGHAFLGQADAVGRSNVLALSVGAEHRLDQRWSAVASAFAFRLADDDDALYDAGGRPIVPGGSATSNTVGYELDLRVNYQLDGFTSFQAGYSHFFAGDALSEAGRDDDLHFFYLQAETTF